MSRIKMVVLGIALAFIGFLLVGNLDKSRFAIFPGVTVEMPLFLLVLAAYGAGAATAVTALWVRGGKKKDPLSPQ